MRKLLTTGLAGATALLLIALTTACSPATDYKDNEARWTGNQQTQPAPAAAGAAHATTTTQQVPGAAPAAHE